jgi:hypothetical protein
MLHRVGFGHVRGPLADDDGHLGLAPEDRGGIFGRTMVSPSPMTELGDLKNALIGAGSLLVPSSM